MRKLLTAGARAPAPHRPARSSSILAALLAVGVVLGFVVLRTSSNHDTVGSSSSSTTTSSPAPSTTQAQQAAPPETSTTTTARQLAAPDTVAGSELCTPSDLTVSATSDASSYAPGAAVQVSTVVYDHTACTFDPQGGGGYPCPSNVVVVNGSGDQVWPWPGQGEQCSPPAAQALQPGDQLTLQATWNEQVQTAGGGTEQSPPATYQVLGTWSWSAGSGQTPYQVQGSSTTFSIS